LSQEHGTVNGISWNRIPHSSALIDNLPVQKRDMRYQMPF